MEAIVLEGQTCLVERAMALLADGRLSVHVDEVFDWHDVGATDARLDAGHTTGKLLLRIGR